MFKKKQNKNNDSNFDFFHVLTRMLSFVYMSHLSGLKYSLRFQIRITYALVSPNRYSPVKVKYVTGALC